MAKAVKGISVVAVALCVVAAGAFFGYKQFFPSGIDHLPEKVCDEAIDRDAVAAVLPDARKAEHHVDYSDKRRETMTLYPIFNCRVTARGEKAFSDDYSILSGRANFSDVSRKRWSEEVEDKLEANEARVSSHGVIARADLTEAYVYVPCIPRGMSASGASEAYSISVESGFVGATRSQRGKLRQALTDFSYQLAVHAFEVNDCGNSVDFPSELPRYRTDS